MGSHLEADLCPLELPLPFPREAPDHHMELVPLLTDATRAVTNAVSVTDSCLHEQPGPTAESSTAVTLSK